MLGLGELKFLYSQFFLDGKSQTKGLEVYACFSISLGFIHIDCLRPLLSLFWGMRASFCLFISCASELFLRFKARYVLIV